MDEPADRRPRPSTLVAQRRWEPEARQEARVEELRDRGDPFTLGRRSYEFLAALWPSRTGELADRLNSLPKYVVSSTLEDPAWNHSTVLGGEAVAEVSELERELDGEINVIASFQLGRTLLEHDLLDELRLMVVPVVVGAGERLFGETTGTKPMRLLDARSFGDGVAYLTYRLGEVPSETAAGLAVASRR